MQIDRELYFKFPAVLRNKFLNNEIKFPDDTQFEYNDLYTYRAVERTADNHTEVSLNDFQSYFQLNKRPKTPRGIEQDYTTDPHYYGVSTSLSREIVEQKMKFPNPKKKLAAGYVYSSGGPQHTKDKHVCWWLYKDVDLSGFKLIEEKKNE